MMKKSDGVWVCGSCGYEESASEGAEYVITEGQEVTEVIESSGGNTGLPTTEVRCPDCGNDEAYWYLQQIRSADESETRFFVCTSCEHRWREDDH